MSKDEVVDKMLWMVLSWTLQTKKTTNSWMRYEKSRREQFMPVQVLIIHDNLEESTEIYHTTLRVRSWRKRDRCYPKYIIVEQLLYLSRVTVLNDVSSFQGIEKERFGFLLAIHVPFE